MVLEYHWYRGTPTWYTCTIGTMVPLVRTRVPWYVLEYHKVWQYHGTTYHTMVPGMYVPLVPLVPWYVLEYHMVRTMVRVHVYIISKTTKTTIPFGHLVLEYGHTMVHVYSSTMVASMAYTCYVYLLCNSLVLCNGFGNMIPS
jgi:hypothetical protein